MRRIVGDTFGVSVIVGAIMLTLIVVTAATTYAIFVSEQQKKIQDAETVKLQRELENLTILSLENPTYNSPILENISFHITNIHTESTVITSMNINNRIIRQFTFGRIDGTIEEWNQISGKFQIGCLYANGSSGPSSGYLFFDKNNNLLYDKDDIVLDLDYDGDGLDASPTFGDKGGLRALDNIDEPFIFQDLSHNNSNYTRYSNTDDFVIQLDPDNDLIPAVVDPSLDGRYGSRLFRDYEKRPTIFPREQVLLTINNTKTDTFGVKDISEKDAITLHIFTGLTNDFFKTFYPPNAIIKIETESLPGGTSHYILDGSASDQPGDSYIIKWEWNITNASSYTFTYPYGRKAQVDPGFGFGGPHTYWVNLTVTDNFGMKGKSSFQFKP
jgi:hypothetical protein